MSSNSGLTSQISEPNQSAGLGSSQKLTSSRPSKPKRSAEELLPFLVDFAAKLHKESFLKSLRKVARRVTGRKPMRGKIQVLTTAIDNVIRMTIYDSFQMVKDAGDIELYKPQPFKPTSKLRNSTDPADQFVKTQNQKLASMKLKIETHEFPLKRDHIPIEEDLTTPNFPTINHSKSFFESHAQNNPLIQLQGNFNSETKDVSYSPLDNYKGTLKRVHGSAESFDEIDDFDNEIQPIYNELQNSLYKVKRAPEKLDGGLGPFFGVLPHAIVHQKMKDPLASRLGRDRSVKRGNIEAMGFGGHNDVSEFELGNSSLKRSSIPQSSREPAPGQGLQTGSVEIASRKQRIVNLLESATAAIKARLTSSNQAQIKPFLTQFEQIRGIVLSAKDISQTQAETIQKTVKDICAALKVPFFLPQQTGYDTHATLTNYSTQQIQTNARYQKHVGSVQSKSYESAKEDETRLLFHKAHSRKFQEATADSIVIGRTNSLYRQSETKPTKGTRDYLRFNELSANLKRNLLESNVNPPLKEQCFTSAKQKTERNRSVPKKIPTALPNANLGGFLYFLIFLFQRRQKKLKREALHMVQETGRLAFNAAYAKVYFVRLIKKALHLGLKKAIYYQKRKNTFTAELCLNLTKNNKKLLREVFQVLRSKGSIQMLRLSKLGTLFSRRINTNSEFYIDGTRLSPSPKQAIRRAQTTKTNVGFSRSTKAPTLDEQRMLEADSFFMELESEYNQNFGRDLALKQGGEQRRH